MKTISATNLRVQLRDLLADLDTGPVMITKHGKVVAVLSAPDEPVEAVEAAPTTEDTSEAPDASQSPPEPVDEAARCATEEAVDPLDEFEQRIEEIDADFEAYLSSQVPMDRPMP
ncbi:MAG: type II toxin-antitoxin system Phd/YefM family antitoxin [Planctomycetota bacterium]|nr:type II toxin-antitoxin system Phd/YefM family antitoxin [Planctomycetota bacterium]